MTYICLFIPTAYLLVIAALDWYQLIFKGDLKNIQFALLNTSIVVTGSMVFYRTWNGCPEISFWSREVDLSMKTIAVIWLVITSLSKKVEIGGPPPDFQGSPEAWEEIKEQSRRYMMLIEPTASVLFSVGVLLGC
jgi:hypothetical protein